MKTETKNSLDLKTYEFRKASKVDILFPTFDTDPVLLKEAEDRGFGENTPYDQLFNKLFFSGGSVSFKDGLEEPFKTDAWNYTRALMGSFSPKHEHKQAVCAMLLSELVELEK